MRIRGALMGSVIVTYRIMPDGVDVNLDSIEKILREKFGFEKIERVPIAFGLVSIKAVKVIPEIEGEADRLANEIEKINGIKSVEIVQMSRGL